MRQAGLVDRKFAYVAGPLFDEGERWWIGTIEQRVARAGFETFLPLRDNPDKTVDNVQEIFESDLAGLTRADVVVANLNGLTTDDGTAWELGYAHALGKFCVGLYTDWRVRFPDEVVNLMIECSLDAMTRSLEELDDVLAAWLRG